MKWLLIGVVLTVGVFALAGCVFRDTDNELKDYIERAEDVEEFWTGGVEEIAGDSPWYFGVGDPPLGGLSRVFWLRCPI